MLIRYPHTGLANAMRATRMHAPEHIGRVTVRCQDGRMVKHVERRPPWWRRLIEDWRRTA